MKRVLDLIRNSVLIPDAYLKSKLGGASADMQQQVRVRYADTPLFPEGAQQKRSYILLAEKEDRTHPVIPNLFLNLFFVDFYSDRAVEVIEDLWFQMDATVISSYSNQTQGVRSLLANRFYVFSDTHMQIFHTGGPEYRYQEETKLWYMTTLFEAHCTVTPAFKFS